MVWYPMVSPFMTSHWKLRKQHDQNRGKTIVEQILVSEERKKSRGGGGLSESPSAIQVVKLTV